MKLQHLSAGAAALAMAFVVPAPGASVRAAEKEGSAYVQCDGYPNNVSTGETAARLLGAVTLLGLFAPPLEAADVSKRKFGEAGVAACNALLTGEGQESNANRRLGLILGRAIHQIEAKNYEAALADVAQGRREAEAAGLMANPYFARSRGRSFDLVESAALLRMGRAEDARAASLRSTSGLDYSLIALWNTPTYADLIPALSAEEEKLLAAQSRLFPGAAHNRANRLELAGRFSDAARVRDALVEINVENGAEVYSSSLMARAAVTHALAGNNALAEERAKAARANAEARKAAGKPETDVAEYVELMDLYDIISTAMRGDAKTARRLFAARSQWVGASLGSVVEVNKRLRQGAAPDELIGGLAKDGQQLWKEHSEAERAALLAKDSDNKSLFVLAQPLRPADRYEDISRTVWRTEKSKILLKPNAKKPSMSKMELLFLPFVDPTVSMEAYVMHAALLARSRGHQGFIFWPVVTEDFAAASFRTGNPGDKGLPAEAFISADDVIARLSPVFPHPAEIQQRRKKR